MVDTPLTIARVQSRCSVASSGFSTSSVQGSSCTCPSLQPDRLLFMLKQTPLLKLSNTEMSQEASTCVTIRRITKSEVEERSVRYELLTAVQMHRDHHDAFSLDRRDGPTHQETGRVSRSSSPNALQNTQAAGVVHLSSSHC